MPVVNSVAVWAALLSMVMCPLVAGSSNEKTIFLNSDHLDLPYTLDGRGKNVPQGASASGWILPPNNTAADLKYDDGNIMVTDNGWKLYIRKLTSENMGTYDCQIKLPNGQWWNEKRTLVLKLLSTWKKYELNVAIGLAASLGTLVGMIAACLVYHFRWRSPEEREKEEAMTRDREAVVQPVTMVTPAVYRVTHDNPAFTEPTERA